MMLDKLFSVQWAWLNLSQSGDPSVTLGLLWSVHIMISFCPTTERLLYRYVIALKEIYQNVCPEVPGNPRDVIFPDAEGNRGTNVLVYFS